MRIHNPVYAILAFLLSACSLGNLVDGAEISSEIRDPASVRTPEGVMAVFNGVNISFARVVRGAFSNATAEGNVSFVRMSGLFADELRASDINANFPTRPDESIDSRNGNTDESDDLYGRLHQVRHLAQEARGLLRDIKIDNWEEKLSQLYAIEGYVNIMLADLYCSSIPLSYLHYKKDYTVTKGFSVEEVYERSLSLLDSAIISLPQGSDIIHFINLGKGRALLLLGEYESAASVIEQVPNDYKYQLSYSASYPKDVPREIRFIIANREGINGMPFISENDPRTKTDNHLNNLSPFTFTNGIEARLIEIEAMLHAQNENWISELNSLRTTCTSIAECSVPAPAGIGNISGLSPIEDSSLVLAGEARFNKRIDMLFRERAYWLFLMGRRQGDLRRLIRHYGRQQQNVYPTGSWGNMGFAGYGTGVSLPVPKNELDYNPLYKECTSQDA